MAVLLFATLMNLTYPNLPNLAFPSPRPLPFRGHSNSGPAKDHLTLAPFYSQLLDEFLRTPQNLRKTN